MALNTIHQYVKFFTITLLISWTLGLSLAGCGALTTAGAPQPQEAAETTPDINSQDAGREEETGEEIGNERPAEERPVLDEGVEPGLNPGAEPQGENPAPGDDSGADPGTGSVAVRPYYTLEGDPPTAPGLALSKRRFVTEPQKIAYLTFDDGPHPSATPKILKILKEEQVPATFFVIGYLAERYPDLLRAAHKDGHAIGNHSYSHNYDLIYQSPEAFLDNIKRAEKVIAEIIGEPPKIIRAPGGTHTHFRVDYYNLLDSHGYLVFDWNVSIGDAAAPLVPAKTLLENLKAQVPGKNRVIILMHDAGGKSTTVEVLPEIIKYLKANGYSFGVLSPEVRPILFPGGFAP